MVTTVYIDKSMKRHILDNLNQNIEAHVLAVLI